jgi:hypothetical protein
MKTIAGLYAAIFLLGSLAVAQAQQNMGTPRIGTGMGQVPPSFRTPSKPRGFVTGPQRGELQKAPETRSRMTAKKTR